MVISRFDAIVLAGGKSSRMGIDKATLSYASQTLLERSLDSVIHATQTVVVAPDSPDLGDVRRVLEDPPFGGPVAGIAVGLADLQALEPQPWVLLLAVDYPEAPAAVSRLLSEADEEADADGFVAVDADGVRQNLLGVYRRPALEAAIADLGEVRDRSVRRLVAALDVAEVALDAELARDVDDPDTARRYGIEVPRAQ